MKGFLFYRLETAERLCLEVSHDSENPVSAINCRQLRSPLCSLYDEDETCMQENKILSTYNSELSEVIADLVHQLLSPKVESLLDCPPLYEEFDDNCFLHLSSIKVRVLNFIDDLNSRNSDLGNLGRSQRFLSQYRRPFSICWKQEFRTYFGLRHKEKSHQRYMVGRKIWNFNLEMEWSNWHRRQWLLLVYDVLVVDFSFILMTHFYFSDKKKNPNGCLSLEKIEYSFFMTSKCSELKSPLCFKENGKVSSFHLDSKCGPNTFIDAKGECYCLSSYFEAKPGDANSTVGCKNPCNISCQGPNTFCQPLTAEEFQCHCKEDFIPIKRNPRLHGCQKKSILCSLSNFLLFLIKHF